MAQDLPGSDDLGIAPSDDDGESSIRWMRSGVWIGVILALLMLYFLVLPAGIIFLDNNGYFDHTSSVVDTAIEVSLAPIIWLVDNVSVYETYIDWLDSKFP